MNRRRFLRDMGGFLKTAGFMGLLPLMWAQAADRAVAAPRSLYSPGRGPALQEIAARKLHHGGDRYLNPF